MAPVALVIIFNTIMFVLGVRVLIKSTRQKAIQGNNRKNTKTTIKLIVGICGVMIMFGLAWAFGILTVNVASKTFQYLFVIFNVFQGFYFFVFICLLGKDGRNFWFDLLKLKSFKKSFFKTTLSDGHHSQVFKSVQTGSITVSSKNSVHSQIGNSMGSFHSPQHDNLELNSGSLTVRSNNRYDSEASEPEVNTNFANKVAMIAEEETSLVEEKIMDEEDVKININFVDDVGFGPGDFVEQK